MPPTLYIDVPSRLGRELIMNSEDAQPHITLLPHPPSDMQEVNVAAKTAALALYLSCVRRLLRPFLGYECQEANGDFMLAFAKPLDAVYFCLAVWAYLTSFG